MTDAMAKTIQHNLQQFDPGIVWLDARNIIIGMNGVATEVLGDRTGELIGEEVLSIHPEKCPSRAFIARRTRESWLRCI